MSRILQTIPEDVELQHIGLMLSRSEHGLRLCLAANNLDRAIRLLADVGWSGPLHQVENVLESTAGTLDLVAANLDLVGLLLPSVGLEFRFSMGPPSPEFRMHRLLHRLVKGGLCTKSKRDALAAFPGLQIDDFLYQREYVRGINHVKVTFRPDRAPEAKAYFGCTHRALGAGDAI